MTDTTTLENTAWPDRNLTENQQRVRSAAELIPVSNSGTRPENFAQLVDYCTWMSKASGAVGSHLINNVGACLAVMEIAQKFGFPGYMVARQTYLVNGQIAFMGQLIMAIINKFAPLKERLKFSFEGQGPELRVIVTGHIQGEVDPVIYRSPMFKDIPVKNSPLWKSDAEQQFCYFGARRWQSRYWPEGLFGVYSPEELAEYPEMNQHVGADNAKDVTPGEKLKERLATADRSEGHQTGHADKELANLATGAGQTILPAQKPQEGQGEAPAPGDAEHGAETGTQPKSTRRRLGRRGKGPDPEQPAPEATAPELAQGGEPEATAAAKAAAPEEPAKPKGGPPTTAAEYQPYAAGWIDRIDDRDEAYARWEGEDELRNQLMVPIKARLVLRNRLDTKFGG